MSKFIVALAIATSANVYSGNETPVVDTAVKTTPWDVIGMYETDRAADLKFIKPVKGCDQAKQSSTDIDYLLQLHACHQKRKGWLKI